MVVYAEQYTDPPELTPTARSDTIASSQSSFLLMFSSPFAASTANALVHTTDAELDRPPPLGTVPSHTMSMPTDVNFPRFFCSSSDTPLRPDLK